MVTKAFCIPYCKRYCILEVIIGWMYSRKVQLPSASGSGRNAIQGTTGEKPIGGTAEQPVAKLKIIASESSLSPSSISINISFQNESNKFSLSYWLLPRGLRCTWKMSVISSAVSFLCWYTKRGSNTLGYFSICFNTPNVWSPSLNASREGRVFPKRNQLIVWLTTLSRSSRFLISRSVPAKSNKLASSEMMSFILLTFWRFKRDSRILLTSKSYISSIAPFCLSRFWIRHSKTWRDKKWGGGPPMNKGNSKYLTC